MSSQNQNQGIAVVPNGNIKKVLRGNRSLDKPIKVLEEQAAEDEEDKIEYEQAQERSDSKAESRSGLKVKPESLAFEASKDNESESREIPNYTPNMGSPDLNRSLLSREISAHKRSNMASNSREDDQYELDTRYQDQLERKLMLSVKRKLLGNTPPLDVDMT